MMLKFVVHSQKSSVDFLLWNLRNGTALFTHVMVPAQLIGSAVDMLLAEVTTTYSTAERGTKRHAFGLGLGVYLSFLHF